MELNRREATAFPVMEHFYTVQGEGLNTGRAAYFVRLGGCDVGCTWCDVKESWEADKHPVMTIEDILQVIAEHPAKLVVITGGEPAMYPLDELTAALQKAGYETAIETSGSYPLTGSWNWVCVSPKKFKAPLPEVLSAADELKVIVYNDSDLTWAATFLPLVNSTCSLLVQPEYSRFDRMIPEIVSFVKRHPEWRISLQTHKIIQVP